MAWGIKLVGTPDSGYSCRIVNPWEGGWLAAYDADARAGLGEAVFSPDTANAMRFDTFGDARECWFAQSTVMPTQGGPDGKPFENRPLAVCDISIDELD